MSAGFILKLGSDVGDFKPHNVMYGDKKGDSRRSIDIPPVDGAYPTAEDEEPDADQVASALAANGGRGGGAFGRCLGVYYLAGSFLCSHWTAIFLFRDDILKVLAC